MVTIEIWTELNRLVSAAKATPPSPHRSELLERAAFAARAYGYAMLPHSRKVLQILKESRLGLTPEFGWIEETIFFLLTGQIKILRHLANLTLSEVEQALPELISAWQTHIEDFGQIADTLEQQIADALS